MAITPGKCPQPEGCPPFTEKDCIEVFKVFDQCVTEELLGNCVPAADFCTGPIPEGSTTTCSVVSAVCFFIGYGPYTTPYYRPVRLLQRVEISVTVTSPAGVVICGPYTNTLQTVTQALMWAPPGTFVQCQILDAGDCSCEVTTDPLTGVQLVCCQAKVCKEVQVKALVKLLVPSYGYCELEPCEPAPQPEFPCPPEPIYPPQRCQDPPSFALQTLPLPAVGVPNVSISLIRKVDTTTVTITKVTNASGIASFAEIGGFAGGLDEIRFTDPLTSKTVVFPIPVEFIGTDTLPHDNATACNITFIRQGIVEPASLTYAVTIDNVIMVDLVDP